MTIGEGYHNFHHQFPQDFRNAIKWYQYDPTKWFIRVMQWIGLATHLKVRIYTSPLQRLLIHYHSNSPITKSAKAN